MHYGETAFHLMQATIGRRSHAGFGLHGPYQCFLIDVLISDAVLGPPGAPRRATEYPPHTALLIVWVIIEEVVCHPIAFLVLLCESGFALRRYPPSPHGNTIVLLCVLKGLLLLKVLSILFRPRVFPWVLFLLRRRYLRVLTHPGLSQWLLLRFFRH
jgi:hypothetical protein